MAIFDFFGGGKEAEDVKEPQQPQPPKQPEPPQPIRPVPRSKEAIEDKKPSGARSTPLWHTFGTDNLDYLLDKFAPETMDRITRIEYNQTELKSNQIALYEKMQEHEEWMRRLESKLDFISSVVGDIAEKTLGRAYPKPNDYDDAEHK